MKRRRESAKLIPRRPPMVSTKMTLLNADKDTDFDDFGNAEFDSRMEDEAPLAGTNMSSNQLQISLPQANTNIGSADSTSIQRRFRGPTRCLNLWNSEGSRIPIVTNDLGQPIGLQASKLTSFLGTMARNGLMAPLTHVEWRAMPDANKENMWQQVQLKFDIHPRTKSWVLMSLGKKWKNWKSKLKAAHYNTHATDEERLADCDERVLPDQWATLISYWSSEEGEKRCASNKASRSQQKFSHTTGTKSFARVHEEQRAKRPDGKEPSRAELFILTRTRKDGKPVNEASSAVISQLRERGTQPTLQDSERPQDDILSQVMGQDRLGCLRLYGLGSPNPIRVEPISMVSMANVEVCKMKERMVAMEQTCAQMASQMATMSPNPIRAEPVAMVPAANVEICEMKERMVAMEQTCAQMATMMSLMSSMQNFPDKNQSNLVADTTGASKDLPQQ